MTEYITKERALEIVKRTSGDYAAAFAEISALPAADVAPVIRAIKIKSEKHWDELYCLWETCGNCGGVNQAVASYCNWCGARLDGEEE